MTLYPSKPMVSLRHFESLAARIPGIGRSSPYQHTVSDRPTVCATGRNSPAHKNARHSRTTRARGLRKLALANTAGDTDIRLEHAIASIGRTTWGLLFTALVHRDTPD